MNDRLTSRRNFVATVAVVLLASSSGLRAQGPATRRRIGYLSGFTRADTETALGLLRPDLEKLGWTDGRNIEFLEPRTAEGRNENLASLADRVVAERPDLIVVQTLPATRALMQATKSIPIVMMGVGNPVEAGLVQDLGKPGGNVTGSSYLADETIRKTLELLKEAAPGVRSVALFVNPTNQAAARLVKQMKGDVPGYGMQLQVVEVSGPGDFEAAFAAIRRERTESVLLIPEPLIRGNRDAIADFAYAQKLPLANVGAGQYLPAHGLFSYGPTTAQYAQITARYVDRILRGAKPGDLPVEQPARFELVINLKTAKALGLTIPQPLLLRADELIQ